MIGISDRQCVVEELELVAMKAVSVADVEVNDEDERGEGAQEGCIGAERSYRFGDVHCGQHTMIGVPDTFCTSCCERNWNERSL